MKTREDVRLLMDRVFAELQETREAGQKEYAHDESNALANFERTGKDLGIAREKVLYIFAKKHWDGVLAWINGHRSQREDVRGRIKDMIVYLVLLWAMADDEEDQLSGFEHEPPTRHPIVDLVPRCEAVRVSVTKEQKPCTFPRGHRAPHITAEGLEF